MLLHYKQLCHYFLSRMQARCQIQQAITKLEATHHYTAKFSWVFNFTNFTRLRKYLNENF